MNKTVHTIAGTVPFLFLTVSQPEGIEVLNANVLPALALLGAIASSPLPDWDTRPMHYSRNKKGVSKKIAQAKTKAVNTLTGGHRGITHTLLFPALFFALMVFSSTSLAQYSSLCNIVMSVLFGLFSGWSLHIFADLFNGKGCPLFWPIMKSKVNIMDIPSEGFVPYIWLLLYSGIWFLIIF